MLLHDARRDARFRDGELVLLADQDRRCGTARRSPPAARARPRARRCGGRGPYVAAGGDRVAARRRAARLARRSRRSTASSPGSPARRWSSSTAPSRSPRPTGRRPALALVDAPRPRRLPLPPLDARRAACAGSAAPTRRAAAYARALDARHRRRRAALPRAADPRVRRWAATRELNTSSRLTH